MPHRAVFLDRDGVINALVWNDVEKVMDSPYELEDFRLLEGVSAAIARLRSAGYLAVVVSNQPGIAKGKCNARFIYAVNEAMRSALGSSGAVLDGVYYCLHHPEATVESYRVICDCRKPKPGLILHAARELEIDRSASFMVGDSTKDILAGREAGCVTVSVGDVPLAVGPAPELSVKNLPEAIEKILEFKRR